MSRDEPSAGNSADSIHVVTLYLRTVVTTMFQAEWILSASSKVQKVASSHGCMFEWCKDCACNLHHER